MLDPILFALGVMLPALLRIIYKWGFNAGYSKAHRRHNPGALIPEDKYHARNSVLHLP